MKNSILFSKAKAFALRIVQLHKFLRSQSDPIIAKKMLRSGTSIGANVAESLYAHSRADLASKLQIALKEASETAYWLELLRDSGSLESDSTFDSIYDDCAELIAMLTASVNVTKAGG